METQTETAPPARTSPFIRLFVKSSSLFKKREKDDDPFFDFPTRQKAVKICYAEIPLSDRVSSFNAHSNGPWPYIREERRLHFLNLPSASFRTWPPASNFSAPLHPPCKSSA